MRLPAEPQGQQDGRRPRGRSAKGLWQGLLLLSVSLILVLTVLELVIRQFVPRPARYLEPQVLGANSPTLKWELKPNQRSFSVDVPVVTNSHGFRDPERSIAKGANTFRILSIGDSITFGMGVRFDAVYSQQLEKVLNATFRSPRFEVINMGVAGYNTRQELIALKEKGIRYEPDLVILGFYWNDIIGNEKALPWEPGFVPEGPTVDTDGNVLWRRQHLIPRDVRDLMREWRTLYFTVQRAKGLLESISPSTHPYFVYYRALLTRDERYLEASWKSTEKRLREIAELGRRHRFPVAILIIPDGSQMMAKYRDINYQSSVKQIAERVGVPSIDLLPEFESSFRAGVRPFLDSNTHPNEVGHRIAATQIARFIASSGMIPQADAVAQTAR